LIAGAFPVSGLLTFIQGSVREPIIDRTGLNGRFDIDLDWASDSTVRASGMDDEPPLPVALQDQLGLRLDSRTETMETLIIDSVELPTPD